MPVRSEVTEMLCRCPRCGRLWDRLKALRARCKCGASLVTAPWVIESGALEPGVDRIGWDGEIVRLADEAEEVA